eukprot:3204833-Amphidinium_carterae.1
MSILTWPQRIVASLQVAVQNLARICKSRAACRTDLCAVAAADGSKGQLQREFNTMLCKSCYHVLVNSCNAHFALHFRLPQE